MAGRSRQSRQNLGRTKLSLGSALACLEALLHLVDHVNATLAAHQAIGAVARAQRLQRISDFHLNTDGLLIYGGRDRDRTCDPYDVNVVLYR